MKRYWKFIIIICVVLFCLFTCGHRKQHNQNNTVTVTAQPLNSTLYYSGLIEPLKTMVVTSPADGVINSMMFHYGDVVQEGQALFEIVSEKFQTDYKAALMQYIKAKTDFVNQQTQMQQGEFLHKNQLISDDDFKAKQTNFYNAQLALLQAKETLDHLSKQVNLQGMDLYELKIEEIDKISQLLHNQNGIRQLHVAASRTGVVLLPPKSDSDGDLKKIAIGDQVKQGDVLAVIGNENGFSIRINVSEFNINQLKIGQAVQVTGAAFPNFILHGVVAGLNRQGQTTQGGLPTFPVEISVNNLTSAQKAVIHMGMSAKVAISLGDDAKIAVPIQAVFQKNGQAYVKVQDDKTGKLREVAVQTGSTTLDSVVVESNLAAGEKVVVPG